MILKLVVDILTVEFCVDMCQDKIVECFHRSVDSMAVVVLLLNGKEQEHKLEHGTNQIADISELKIEHKLEPELQKETVVSTYLYLPEVS